MLNKLLKRCMPWMDKGRWYQIRIVGTDQANLRAIFNDDDIESVEIVSGGGPLRMDVTLKRVMSVIDCKFCQDAEIEFVSTPTDFNIATADKLVIEVILGGPGTYWFFMR